MQLLIAVVVMGSIGVFAVVLTAAAALIQVLPVLAVVLIFLGALRWWELRRRPAAPRSTAACPPAFPPVAPPPPPVPPRLAGWMMVPVWVDLGARTPRRPAIDVEVLSVEEHDG